MSDPDKLDDPKVWTANDTSEGEFGSILAGPSKFSVREWSAT